MENHGAKPRAETSRVKHSAPRQIGCRYELDPDAGHISNLENPAFVNEVPQRRLAKQLHAPGQ